MSTKASYSRIQNRDSLIIDPPARTLRKKVSRAFGNLARRASSASLREHRAKQEQQEQDTPPVPPLPPKPTGRSSSSSTSTVDDEVPPPPSAIVQYYTHPVWRIDPVLIGCFVWL
ncbi:hypothetical protein C8Q76DRAFT_749651 [Earliella scabrosa]|nr:hypothetical protein C8Q76DRAFT_749651 [Earliella scabrosa]